jgi:glucose dehydrogenase
VQRGQSPIAKDRFMTVRTTRVRSNRKIPRSRDDSAHAILAIAGFVFALGGVGLAIVGSTASASSFHLVVGSGLIVSGALLAKRMVAGAWTLLAVFVAIAAWSLSNAGSNGSSLAYRLIGPITLLAMIAVVLPALGRRTPRQTAALFAAFAITTVTVGIIFRAHAGISQ